MLLLIAQSHHPAVDGDDLKHLWFENKRFPHKSPRNIAFDAFYVLSNTVQ